MLSQNIILDWAGTVAVANFLVAVATTGFASLSAGLFNLGAGTIKDGPHLHGYPLGAAAYTYYLWHLADAVPLLKIPETLNWELKHPFTDSLHGALVLAYTVVVAIPIVFAATRIVRDLTSDPEPTVEDHQRTLP